MSGFDPLAAAAAQAVANAQHAIDVATLDLGTSAAALRAQIRTGDLLEAIVLPPQNGSDRLSLFGKTIDAQLPPGVHPGESLLLQVAAFSGTQIVVRNLGALDPALPKPSTIVAEPLTPPQSPATQPTVVSQAQTQSTAAQASAVPPRDSRADISIAPPREVFVAASVKRILVGEAAARAQTPSGAQIGAQRAPVERGDRLAVPFVAARNGSAPSLSATLLSRLRVPISASTLVAARMVDDAAKHVTSAYRRLDEVLAKVPVPDARISSLRSLLAFTGKIDLRNGRVLPEQIAAFVAHVVEGAEGKIAQVVRALLTEEQLSATETPVTQAPATESARRTVTLEIVEPPPAALQLPAPSPDALARATERVAALDHDVKAVMLSLLHDPPPGMTPQSTQALTSAIGATTALQLGVLAARDGDPNAISIPLPAYFYDGGKPAQLRISRDRNPSGKNLDGDNFSVSFVLDTKTLGTVAIDLQTARRAVRVSVKTERQSAANAFRDTLSSLRDRLELLRYRVASMAADVARTAPAPNVMAVNQPVVPASPSNVDLRA